MPLSIVDYLADTGHLSAAEHGAYLLLIMRYWQDGGLPEDERLIARYSKLDAQQWADSRDVLAAFFDDGWRHKRIEAEIAKAEDIISKRKSAAEQRYSKPVASAVHMQSTSTYTRVPPSPTPEPSKEEQKEPRARRDVSEFRSELSDLDTERLDAIIKHRRSKRGQLTGHAARLFRQDAAACSLTLPEAVDACISRNWITVKPEYFATRARAGPQQGKVTTLDVGRMLMREMERTNAATETEIGGHQQAPRLLSAG